MLTTQSVIESLAARIERAYRRRRPDWRGVSSTPRVWEVAAEALYRAQEADRTLPLDPELFVASQPCDTPLADPWAEVTGPAAVRRYRGRVARIVLVLKGELAAEVRLAEARVGRGEAITKVLLSRSRRLSPLGRYIVACRAGRPALANRFLRKAVDQHRSCPLYRRACAGFLPDASYPTIKPEGPTLGLDTAYHPRARVQFRWN